MRARYGSEDPPGPAGDRRAHFRALRETVLMWQRDEIDAPPERFAAFAARVADAMQAMEAAGRNVLAVSSGGAISKILAEVMECPPAQMMTLQLQMKNCAVSRLVGRPGRFVLHGFNDTPFLCEAADERLLSYA